MGSQLQLCLQWVVTNIKCTKFWSPLVWLLLPLQMQSLDMAMDMVMGLVVSALELVFTQLGQFMSPDLLRVLVREVLTQSQDIIHRTTGHQWLLLTATLPAMDVMAREVLSLDI